MSHSQSILVTGIVMLVLSLGLYQASTQPPCRVRDCPATASVVDSLRTAVGGPQKADAMLSYTLLVGAVLTGVGFLVTRGGGSGKAKR